MKEKVFICDRIELQKTSRKITDEGFLLVPAKISRAGIYDYLAKEIGAPGKEPDEPVKVYRPPECVFAEDSIASFALKPVTLNHPTEMLSTENVKKYQVGHVGESIKRAGEYLAANMLITDSGAIAAINDGQCEVSSGYNADLDFTPGYTPTGEKYDALMSNMRGNHVAIVDVARGGRGCRIEDSKKTGETITMKKIIFDGLEIETTEQGATVVEKLQAQLEAAKAQVAQLETQLASVQGESQAQLDEMGAQLEEAKSAVPTPEELDQIVEDRAAVIADAKSVFSAVETKGKTIPQIVESVVVKVCDGIDLSKFDDKTREIYCRARFDGIVSSAKKTINDGSQRVKIDGAAVTDEDPVEAARQRRIKETEQMYKITSK